MTWRTIGPHLRRAPTFAWVLLLAGSMAACRQATPPPDAAGQEPAPRHFSGASLGPTATSTRKVLDLAALRTCLELGAERDWRSSEVERLDSLFGAATARSKSLEQWLETPPPEMDANVLLRRILWARELDRLTQEREEMGGTLLGQQTQFVQVNNTFFENCANADYREADLRSLGVDHFGKDEKTDAIK